MNGTERATSFVCGSDTLIGVLSVPERVGPTAVVIVVGGPQYRAGSHRQFVLLARRLAAAGHAVLRFDYRGMGDSEGDTRDFESVDQDIAAAIDHLRREMPQVQRVVLWGLCDGASAALLYTHRRRDPRVGGLCLLNPWVRSAETHAQTQVKHYYWQRVRRPEFWAKLLKGGVGARALGEFAGSLKTVVLGNSRGDQPSQGALSFHHEMAAAWRQPGQRILLLLSGRDFTAKEFLERCTSDSAWQGALDLAAVQRHDLPEADHTFSESRMRLHTEVLLLNWLRAGAPMGERSSA